MLVKCHPKLHVAAITSDTSHPGLYTCLWFTVAWSSWTFDSSPDVKKDYNYECLTKAVMPRMPVIHSHCNCLLKTATKTTSFVYKIIPLPEEEIHVALECPHRASNCDCPVGKQKWKRKEIHAFYPPPTHLLRTLESMSCLSGHPRHPAVSTKQKEDRRRKMAGEFVRTQQHRPWCFCHTNKGVTPCDSMWQ